MIFLRRGRSAKDKLSQKSQICSPARRTLFNPRTIDYPLERLAKASGSDGVWTDRLDQFPHPQVAVDRKSADAPRPPQPSTKNELNKEITQ